MAGLTKKDMAEFCAKISSAMNKTKSYEEWVEYYMSLSTSELSDEYASYMC